MPPSYTTPFKHLQNPSSLLSLLRNSNPNDTTTTNNKRTKPSKKGSNGSNDSSGSGGGLLRMFRLFPLLSSGCKVVALLASGSRRRAMIADHATIVTFFGPRRGRTTLAIQEDPQSLPFFVLELPMSSFTFHKEIACDIIRIVLESENKTHKKKLMEEFVWAVYCNGRKVGYSIRRMQLSEEDLHVMQMLRGISMGAGILPIFSPPRNNNNNNNNNIIINNNNNIDYNINSFNSEEEKNNNGGDELTYLRSRFERAVGSKDSEALYMINPDHQSEGPELSIFLVRGVLN